MIPSFPELGLFDLKLQTTETVIYLVYNNLNPKPTPIISES